ncbi:MAG: single-stranded-DNA-specific exonuclease RecJ [Candidatus Marinimicrobia bacterium]|nr:single-stranded-DNA-specific exonuclease RecJ [Candidatus Neomarinimicrobiota bacterium]
MNYNWEIKQTSEDSLQQVIDEFKLPKSIATIMAQRGIIDRENSRNFFYPDLNNLHDPFLMLGMEKSVTYIQKLIEEKKTILLFGDYDVDGTTGTSTMFLFFKSLGVDVHYYIPNRLNEGYGLSNKGIDFAVEIGAKLLITCDCGITAVDKVEYANSKGLNVIITDHHKQSEILPDAFSIINPNQNKCNYPFKGLCGAGVALKLILAICRKIGIPDENALKYTDLVTLGIAADIVPMIDENRIIANDGIRRIELKENIGINALLNSGGLNGKEITIGRLVFWVSPKINAAGRLGDAGRAVKLMTTTNPILARRIADDLEKENKRRQEITINTVENCLFQVQSNSNIDNEHAVILFKEGWHHGVVGIVASKIKENFNKPTIIISLDETGIGRASCRSIPGFDIHSALSKCSEFLVGFGGHPMAAGFSIEKKNIEPFYKAFQKIALELIKPEQLTPRIKIDYSLDINEINSRFLKFLKSMAPYGPRNMRPKFLSRKVNLKGMPRLIGKKNDTLKFSIQDNKSVYDAIGFNLVEKYEYLLSGEPVDLVFEIGENEWNGKKSIQLEIKDIKPKEQINV